MSRSVPTRGSILLLSVALVATLAPRPAPAAVTKSQVQAACADSDTQYQVYLDARKRFEEAALQYEQVRVEIDELEHAQEFATRVAANRRQQIADVERRIREQAIERYMQGGAANSELVFLAGSVDELITGQEFLSAASEADVGSLDDLLALRADLQRFQDELAERETRLREVEELRAQITAELEEVTNAEREAFGKLSADCKRLRRQYERELAAARAREAARRGSAAGGVPSGATPGFVCPFPGSSFIDTWGAPRSGGRTHKGTDIFGPWNANIIAVASGTVVTRVGGLGGYAIWLISDYGVAYYYAHLSGFNVKSGQRVEAGQVIGFNGNSGNARGGAPHVHFQLHPGGRGSAAVNPYPTLRRACG